MSKTTLERLIYMANQIASNVLNEPDPVAFTADHLEKFWDPRMKAMIAASDHAGLSDIAAAAVARLHVEG